MNIDLAFPSKYLKAADLQGKTVRLKIKSHHREMLGDEQKSILYFDGTEKGLVLNKTNANRIAINYTKETDDWIGKEIEVYPDMVDMQGRMVEAVRVRVPARPPSQRPAPAAPARNDPPPASEADYGAILDDEIPF